MRWIVVCLMLVSCGGSTGPSDAVPALGAYAYTGDVVVPGAPGVSHYQGTLTLTFASADSIAGAWAVTGYQSRAALGFLNADAYVLYAYPTNGGATFPHRIGKGEATLPCELRFTYIDGSGNQQSNVGTCSLTKQ